MDHVEEIIRQAEERGVQIRLASPDKVRLIGPPEVVEEFRPIVLEHKPQILERLRKDPWSWHVAPVDADREAVEQWAAVEYLREILTFEGWTLARAGKWLVVVAEPFFTPEKLKRLNVAIVGVRDCWPTLAPKVEYFPELTPDQARGLLERVEKCHGKEGFRVMGWHGLELPRTWPAAIWSWLYTAYAQSLQTVGLPQ